MKLGFIIIGRMKSTRLPEKLIKKIEGKEIITLMIERLKESEILDNIILATSTNPDDEILCDIANREKIDCFRGSEDDVLKRIYSAADEYNLDYILHVTADTPLVAYEFIEDIVEEYKKTEADLITTYDLPHGFFLYGIKKDAIKKVLKIKATDDTEVWGDYFKKLDIFNTIDISIPEGYKRDGYRLTIDYPEDYRFMKTLFDKMGEDTHKKSTLDLINFLDEHPEIVNINKDCEEKYKERFDQQREVILKDEYKKEDINGI